MQPLLDTHEQVREGAGGNKCSHRSLHISSDFLLGHPQWLYQIESQKAEETGSCHTWHLHWAKAEQRRVMVNIGQSVKKGIKKKDFVGEGMQGGVLAQSLGDNSGPG